MKKRSRAVVWAIVLTLLDSQALAQASRPVVVHAAHLLDVKTGKLLADQMLVIEAGKIVSAFFGCGDSSSAARSPQRATTW